MLKLIAEIAISVYLASTLFMLYFFINAQIVTKIRDGHFFKIPLGLFLYTHFCPIVHTKKVFMIMRKYAIMREAKRRL